MRILVTGANGFIGKALRAHFEARDYEVYSLARSSTSSPRELLVDLTRPQDFDRLPQIPFDVIIHAAGVVGGPRFSSQVMQVNAEGTRLVLKWARRGGCRHFVQVSSIGAYGLRMMGQNRHEASTPRTESLFGISYMRSKARAEVYVEDSGLPHSILRMPSILGANDTFATQAIASTILGGKIPYAVRRDSKVSMLGIANLTLLMERLVAQGPLGGAYNCADHDVAWEDLVTQYATQLGVVPAWVRHSALRILLRPNDQAYHYFMMNSWLGAHFPSQGLWNRLGISPSYSWRETVRDAVRAYRERFPAASPTDGAGSAKGIP